MAEREAILGSQYKTIRQQHDANTLGMWVYLLTELLLFGGLFTAYGAYRVLYPAGMAEGSRHMEVTLGAINTGVLIVSSVMMALAVNGARSGSRGRLSLFLALTAAFGAVFMVIKGIEYYHHYQDGMVPALRWTFSGDQAGQVQLFFLLYFIMTGLHAIHLTIGIVIVLVMLVLALRGRFLGLASTPIDIVGLYWHFVDIVWIFLLPLLYLIGRHG